MRRRSHVIKANHGVELPWECIWYDTETTQEAYGFDGVRHVLRFGWGCYRRRLRSGQWSAPEWYYFTEGLAFWQWVASKLHGKARLYVFSHNQGFDLPVVDAFRLLPFLGFTLTKAIIDCPPLVCKWRRGSQTIEALDTLNVWRVPLESIGRKVGLRKLKMPRPEASEARWRAYGRRDVKVIMRAVLAWFDFLQLHRLGGFAPTLASQAMRAYRHRFMPCELLIDVDNNALQLARAAYVGGRVECYQLGLVHGPVYVLDVNSMYPFVMRDNPYPVKLLSTTRRATLDDLRTWCRDYCVTAEVELFTDEPAYPVLHEGRLLFPINRFRTTLCTPELQLALDRGHVERVHHVAVHERAIIFREFVEELWSLRRGAARAGDVLTEWLLKIFANSLYGKFGQRGRVYHEAGQIDYQEARAWLELDADTGTVIKHRALGGLHQVFSDDAESWSSMPAVAAHVTAYARRHLWHLQQAAGRGFVLYCDTDSLATTQEGFERVRHHVNPEELGALKLERVEPWVRYYGLKDYEGEKVRKAKGVRGRAHWLGEEAIVQDQWSSLAGLLRIGEVTGPITRAVAKHLSRVYTKGLRTPSGRVLPMSLG